MPIVLDGTSGISTPDLESAGPISGTTGTFSGAVSATTGTFSGAVQASGVTTNLYPLVSATAVASTSGTSIDFTGIPSWVRRITVMFSGVSTNGTSIPQIQLGISASFATSGYVGTVDTQTSGGGSAASITSGLALSRSGTSSASNIYSGQAVFTNLTGNNWVGSFLGSITTGQTAITWAATQVTLGGTLTRVRITTVNGTDTFDAGTINIMYE